MTSRLGSAVRLESCAKTYPNGTRALAPTDLAIAPGETVVILGPSGCGKTTMLRIIAGLEQPDPGGRVLFDADDVSRHPIEKRNVGMVFQSYALFPNMNVLDNVAYGLRVRRIPRAERETRAREVLAMMRIGELENRRIDQLSGGQRQRVALARALAVQPRVLLLDEPLTALDAALREHLRTEIDALLRRLHITSVYVTHDQAEAMVLGDRIVVMRQGVIAQIGSPQDIYLHPADRSVAEFVGTMNRLDGTVRAKRFESGAGSLPVARADTQTAAAFFRPEAARLVSPDAAPLVFTVARVHFLGDRQRLYLSAGDGPPVLIDTDNRTSIAPGTRVGLAIAPESLHFF